MELIPRKDIYTGILKRIVINEPVVCRSMLFKLDKDSLAEDLIYTTPTKYPIYNFEYDKNINKNFYIDTIVNMDKVLQYLDYDVVLTQLDLNLIYKKFITHNWWIKHSSYFFEANRLPQEIQVKLLEIGKTKLGLPNSEEPSYGFIKRK